MAVPRANSMQVKEAWRKMEAFQESRGLEEMEEALQEMENDLEFPWV